MDDHEKESESEDVGFLEPPSDSSSTSSKGRRKTNGTNVSGVGAVPLTNRPAGKTGSFPGEEGKIPNDADLLWMHVLDEIQKAGYSPYDMEIRVERKTPAPSIPITTFDGSAVMGDESMSPATALRNYIIDWVHLPSGILGPALYAVYFCWRNRAQFFRRGELRVGSRNEILAMKQAEAARQSQGAGVAGIGSFQHHASAPSVPSSASAPVSSPAAAPYLGMWGVPTSQPFDPEAERARIRIELEREFEMRRLRQEVEELRKRPAGVGSVESDDARLVRLMVEALRAAGIVPAQDASKTIQQSVSVVDDFERAVDSLAKAKRLGERFKELFGERQEPEENEHEKPQDKPAGFKLRFQPTGQKWKDGRETMIPVDENGDPIIPKTLPEIVATGFANPFLIEPIAEGVGALIQSVTNGVGLGQPQHPNPPAPPAQLLAAPQPTSSAPQLQPVKPDVERPAVPDSAQPPPDGGWNFT
jgi:hypothetical protein